MSVKLLLGDETLSNLVDLGWSEVRCHKRRAFFHLSDPMRMHTADAHTSLSNICGALSDAFRLLTCAATVLQNLNCNSGLTHLTDRESTLKKHVQRINVKTSCSGSNIPAWQWQCMQHTQ